MSSTASRPRIPVVVVLAAAILLFLSSPLFSQDVESDGPFQQPRYRSVAAGSGHTCAAATDGRAYCWGFNAWGQLGTGDLDSTRRELPPFGAAAFDTAVRYEDSLPRRVRGDLRFRLLTAGSRHTCGLTRDDRAYCWGFGRFGELGTGDRTSSPVPRPVASDLRFRDLSAGGTHTCGITKSGSAFCWGGNWHGQLGVGEREPVVTRPAPVAGNHRWTVLHAGGIHTCGITTSHRAYCWGDRRDGRVGTGRPEPRDVFEPSPVAGGHRFHVLATSVARSCGVTRGGELRCWGLGRRVPSPVGSFFRGRLPARLALSDTHACAVEDDGVISCLEWREDGESRRVVPAWTDASGAPRVLDVDAGSGLHGGHVCALLEDGTMKCWGDDSFEQLGIYARGHHAGDP